MKPAGNKEIHPPNRVCVLRGRSRGTLAERCGQTHLSGRGFDYSAVFKAAHIHQEDSPPAETTCLNQGPALSVPTVVAIPILSLYKEALIPSPAHTYQEEGPHPVGTYPKSGPCPATT